MKPRAALAPVLLTALLPGLALAPAPAPAAAAAAAAISQTAELRTPVWGSYDKRFVASELFSAPVVGDVTGDGQAEVVAGFPNGHVYVWGPTGTRLLDLAPGSGAVQGTPALADITGDGVRDIVGANLNGQVFGYSARGGRAARVFSKQLPSFHGFNGAFASPAVADLDRDGRVEIVLTSWNQRLYAWTPGGADKPGFPVFLGGTSWASPAVADLDGDRFLDVVVGYDQNDEVQGVPGGGNISVFNHRGQRRPGWPRYVPQVIRSTPAVADITGDGRRDVAVGTGTFFGAARGRAVYAFDHAGRTLPGWPFATRHTVYNAPVIGDVDRDGRNEVAFMDERSFIYVVDRAGRLLPGWPRCGSNDGQCTHVGHGSPSLADVTGDGLVDVVTAGHTTLNVWSAGGTRQASFRTVTGTNTITAPPTIVSIGGRATIFLVARHAAGSSFYGKVLRFTTGAALGPAPWPRFKQNAAGTGSR